ncbi:alkaline phosphatase family protein [Microbacterium hominis]|uniref:Alkaline phosphatase family protein n=1 Tax=Microbacterium hominis TaxID=162426 RepID=A0A7D4UI88_9MICO|nr:nucleotide pyrophosphatase/phosphodiesterase family protein [Microbacterium hominis]QKJ19448.1 alkaline phosphatase family protein [Microbacterium hominis]
MSLSLPVDSPRTRSLTEVVPEMLAAMEGGGSWLAPATSAIVVVLDGLGARNLAARAGHARYLAQAGGRRDVARSVFPSTTATALTGLLTGASAGEHGVVGYRARVPGTDAVVNQLRGWEGGELPDGWQRAAPLTAGRRSFAVSKREYAETGFTRATLGGAQFHGEDDLSARVDIAVDLAARHPGSFTYLYAPDLDMVGHRRGWESDEWIAALEGVDAAMRRLGESLAPEVGAIVTADHGMVDVPRHRHVLLSDGDDLVEGVRLIGGEPRMLHLYTQGGAAADVLRRWDTAEGHRAWVLSRADAIQAGLFGAVDAAVRERIGDVLVAARGGIAYYDDRLADKGPQRMVGQHGSLTDEERTVPLIRLGAFATR